MVDRTLADRHHGRGADADPPRDRLRDAEGHPRGDQAEDRPEPPRRASGGRVVHLNTTVSPDGPNVAPTGQTAEQTATQQQGRGKRDQEQDHSERGRLADR